MPRRATDRVEDITAWLLIAAALLLVVLAGAVAAAVYRDGEQRSGVEATQRHQVSAELITGPVVPAGRFTTGTARWAGPDGVPRTGLVPIMHVRSDPGVQFTMWVDATGAPTRPPSTPTQALQAAVVTAIALTLVGVVALGGIWAGVRALTERCNSARWERDWARVGPRWSRRVH